MCIALLSTAHPDYPLIILDNRDEFMSRPTAPADWWDPPNEHVLGGRDLQRAEQGTWLGITRQGRFAVLTNFRDEGVVVDKAKSRGGIATAWLTSSLADSETPEEFVDRLIRDTGINDVGGFSLWVGHLRRSEHDEKATYPGVTIVSNRTSSNERLPKIASKSGETYGLSNSHFGDRSWPKVVHGEELLADTILKHAQNKSSEDDLVDALFKLLTTDTLPGRKDGESWLAYTRQLRNSIFVPPLSEQRAAADSSKDQIHLDSYGTQQQTVILVDKEHRVKFVQRTLYGPDGIPLPLSRRDKHFEFQIA